MAEVTDAQLVERSLAGDGVAFRALYTAHAPRIKSYLLRSGFSDADADDLTQDVFLRVYRALITFDPQRGWFGGWLSAIARNVARRQWSRRDRPENFDPGLAQETLAGPDDTRADASAREETDAVRACVQRLPQELATVIRLRYVQGRTTRGIADIVGLPESTVRLRLRQAQQRLEECLRAKGFVE